MSGLLEEYRRRHKLDSVVPINEGRLFFNIDDKPGFIALTSSYTKASRCCLDCYKQSDCITLEIFTISIYPECSRTAAHIHLKPDEDILEQISKIQDQLFPFDGQEHNIKPVIVTNERMQEMWLWEWFQSLNPFVFNRLNSYIRSKSSSVEKQYKKLLSDQKRKKTSAEVAFFEQVMWFCQHSPNELQTFYNELYSLCMIGRKYILTG